MTRTDSDPSPGRPLFGLASIPLPTGDEAAAFDRSAIDEVGIPEGVLMENAGRGAALLLDHLEPKGPVQVFVGSGNNGGDGIVLARTLHAFGREVAIVRIGSRSTPDPLLHGHSVPSRSWEDAPDPDADPLERAPSVVVDGLLGTGLRGEPRAPFDEAIGRIAQLRERGSVVVSLDIPSGVDGATGQAPGAAVRSDLTLAFGAPKRGTLLHPGRAHAGRIVALEIGFPPWRLEDASAELITPAWASEARPRRALRSHKKAEGRLLLIGGAPGMSGALVIAGRAALRSGAGYLRLGVAPDERALFHAALPEAVLVDAFDEGALAEAVQDSDAVAAGPGLGRGRLAGALGTALRAMTDSCALLLDADALRMVAAEELPGWQGGPARRRLLTPHPGEASALLNRDAAWIVATPFEAAQEMATNRASTVLLKGTPSVIAEPDGKRIRVSCSGSSEFARGGMGDLLTGVAGTLLARGMSAADAGALALHWTGRAADRLSFGDALLPSDLADELPHAMAEAGPGRTELPHPFVLLDLPRAR